MRPDPVTITIDKDYIVRPLTLRQLREVDEILRNAKGRPQLDITTDVLRAGLSRDYPEVAASLDDLEISMSDLGDYFTKILKVGGIVMETKTPGESVPVPTGTSSTED